MKTSIALLVATTLSLSACKITNPYLETQYDITNVDAILANTTVDQDKFTGETNVVFPYCRANQCRIYSEDEKESAYIKSWGDVFIRSWVINEIQVYQVYAATKNNLDWSFYDRAVSLNGKNYKVNKINSDVDCLSNICSYSEDYGFNLTKEDIEIASRDGLSFELRGKRYSGEWRLPATYFQAILKHGL
jgi:hypothetical protein